MGGASASTALCSDPSLVLDAGTAGGSHRRKRGRDFCIEIGVLWRGPPCESLQCERPVKKALLYYCYLVSECSHLFNLDGEFRNFKPQKFTALCTFYLSRGCMCLEQLQADPHHSIASRKKIYHCRSSPLSLRYSFKASTMTVVEAGVPAHPAVNVYAATLEEIREAANRIEPFAHKTPVRI